MALHGPTMSKEIPLALLLIGSSTSATLAVGACSDFGDGDAPPPPAADVAVPDATAPDASVADSANTPEPTDAGADVDGASACVASPPGLVAWWTADDTLDDHQGAHYASSDSTTYAAGKHGSGFKFPESAAKMTVATGDAPGLDLDTGSTIEAWIQPAIANQNARIVDKITSGATDGYLLDLLEGRPRLVVGNVVIIGADKLEPGTFVHVAGTFEAGAAGRVYISGVEVASVATTLAAIPTNDLPFTIGSTSSGSNKFSGVIDELAVYDRPLSAAEIATIAQAPDGRCK